MKQFLMACLLAFCCLASADTPVDRGGYRFNVPSGWVSDDQGGTTVLAPSTEPAGSVYVVVLPTQRFNGDFEGQFRSLRQHLESSLGLRLIEAQPPQRGKSSTGEYSAVLGRYSSPQGERHVFFMALSGQGAVGQLALIADGPQRFERHSPTVTRMFNGLRLTEAAASSPGMVVGGKNPASAQELQGRALDVRGGISLALLPGIWVSDTVKRDFRVAFGTTTGASGVTYDTMTTSMTTLQGAGGTFLKIGQDGSYRYYYGYRDATCFSTLEHSGRLSLQGNLLLLQPTRAHESSKRLSANAPRSCGDFDRDAQPALRRYKAELSEGKTVYGLASYHLSLTNADVYEAIKGFDRLESRPLPEAAGMMPNSSAPNRLPGANMVGTWAAGGTDVVLNGNDFLSTSKVYSDAQYRAGLRIDANGRYQLVVRRPDVMLAPVCMRNLLLVEQGEVRVAGNAQNGNLILQPTSSRLTDQISHCDADSKLRSADLSLAPRHYFWQVTPGAGGADSLSIGCGDWPDRQAAWRFLSCPQDAGQVYSGYVRQ
jgi:hypothetical protein